MFSPYYVATTTPRDGFELTVSCRKGLLLFTSSAGVRGSHRCKAGGSQLCCVALLGGPEYFNLGSDSTYKPAIRWLTLPGLRLQSDMVVCTVMLLAAFANITIVDSVLLLSAFIYIQSYLH